MEITVYRSNRTDEPTEVSVEELVDTVMSDREYRQMAELMPYNAVNAALSQEFGSFDPNSDTYQRFEEKAGGELLERL